MTTPAALARGTWLALVGAAVPVLVVNTYPLTREFEDAVREPEIAAFCEGA